MGGATARRKPLKYRVPVVSGIVVGAVFMVMGAPAAAAVSGPSSTTTTFTLQGGDLSLATQATAVLSNGASTGSTDISGQLGKVTVIDKRGSTVAWAVSASSTQFIGTDADHTSSLAVSYASGAITKTGTLTLANGTPQNIAGSVVIVTAPTDVHGNNTATWNPTIHVAMPPSALTGTYSATITTSIL